MNTNGAVLNDSAAVSVSRGTAAGSSQHRHTNSNSFGCCTELCNNRMYELCGEKELKVVLALDPGDSISGVARKIDENRETIRRVVNRLEESGYVAYDDGLHLLDQTLRTVGLEWLTATAATSPPSIQETYVLPQFAGMEYAYAAIDAVYVWTRGGYQVARDPEDYPLFIAVNASDLDAWVEFFDRFGIPTAEDRQPAEDLEGPIQVVLEPRSQVETRLVDGRPVVPIEETVAFANEYYATFQSALDMLDRMYDDVDIDANYRMDPTRA